MENCITWAGEVGEKRFEKIFPDAIRFNRNKKRMDYIQQNPKVITVPLLGLVPHFDYVWKDIPIEVKTGSINQLRTFEGNVLVMLIDQTSPKSEWFCLSISEQIDCIERKIFPAQHALSAIEVAGNLRKGIVKSVLLGAGFQIYNDNTLANGIITADQKWKQSPKHQSFLKDWVIERKRNLDFDNQLFKQYFPK